MTVQNCLQKNFLKYYEKIEVSEEKNEYLNIEI